MQKLGPFTQGEIPEPLVVSFKSSSGDPLVLTGYQARWITALRAEAPVEHTANITDAAAGEVTYEWADGDLGEAGDYRGEMWVGNGTNRFASERYEFTAQGAIEVPAI